ncbi:putative 37S ribosomal protein [Xylariales sp. AK1849]|nr:putative 37S ribosomal protein [Xylariales sp. AK1849]
MFKPRLRIPRVNLPRQNPSFRRSLHSVPLLSYTATQGIPNLLTRDGFNLAWEEYMAFVTEKLNILTEGTEYAQKTTHEIIKLTAREPSLAATFNYASMAHNNHFFFKNLNAKGELVPMPEKLRSALEYNFSSIETLRLEMTLTADAMFGPGFVWLVKNMKTNSYRILTTYLAGSPYAEAHWRRQGVDTNTMAGPTSAGDKTSTTEFFGRTQLGAGADNGSAWNSKNVAPGGIDVTPLLCLNTWEHVWLRDYGIGAGGFGGKKLFVENWWNCINWENVADDAQLHRTLKT